MKLIITGHPLAEPLTIYLTEGEASVMDGPALNRAHAVQILNAWTNAPPDLVEGLTDTVRRWAELDDNSGFITAVHDNGEIILSQWSGVQGYYIADWPFNFEWNLVDDVTLVERLPIEQRVPGWKSLNGQARQAIRAHDEMLQPDAWFKGVHDGRVLEYLAAINSGADGDSSDAIMVSVLFDFGSRVVEVSTRQLRDNVWTTGYDA